VTQISVVAELHDVGKGAIPDTILNKPAPGTQFDPQVVAAFLEVASTDLRLASA
jgi:HD-GYP domain-containing protein (c-di-GMP phosphodiesterase class II)